MEALLFCLLAAGSLTGLVVGCLYEPRPKEKP